MLFDYNIVIGRSAIAAFTIVISTSHQKFEFPTTGGVAIITTNYQEAWSCYGTSTKPYKMRRDPSVKEICPFEEDPNEVLQIGGELTKEL